MYHSGYETEAVIRLHQEALRREAERERPLGGQRLLGVQRGPLRLGWALARAGRLLIATGRWLEAYDGGRETVDTPAAG